MAKKAKLQRVGEVASDGAQLSLIIADAKVAKHWQGVGDDADRARMALVKKDFAMLDVAHHPAVVLTFRVGQGTAHVFAVGERFVVVETTADPAAQPFLEFVASDPQKPRSIANLTMPSKKLVLIATSETAGLALTVAAKVSLAIEPLAKHEWGDARRFFVSPA